MVKASDDRALLRRGVILVKEFLEPKGVTQRDLANGIRVPHQRVNEIVNGRRGITASTALRLPNYIGESEEFWLYLQIRWDLHHSRRSEQTVLEGIQPIAA